MAFIKNILTHAFQDVIQGEANKITLAAIEKEVRKRVLDWQNRQVTRTRSDIKTWKDAQAQYELDEDPRTYMLQNIFDEILLDAHLTSQIENRNQQVYSFGFSLLKPNGEKDEEATKALKKMPLFRQVCDEILMSRYRGYSIGEIVIEQSIDGQLIVKFMSIPRAHVVPMTGKFYPQVLEDRTIPYRDVNEYGSYILEFVPNESQMFGLLNKAVPYILFKKFALSCWSELCEIYGIPPRVLKTNTHDKAMLGRAEKMMKDWGAAAWFIIDQSEEFEFAKAVSTNGDVYENLIKHCNNEISMLVSGAVIGQDTKNGSNAKEEANQSLLSDLIQSDIEYLEQVWNSQVLPALSKLGLLPKGNSFEFDPAENVGELWNRTKEILSHAEVDWQWIKDKFGIEVLGPKKSNSLDPEQNQLRDNQIFPFV